MEGIDNKRSYINLRKEVYRIFGSLASNLHISQHVGPYREIH